MREAQNTFVKRISLSTNDVSRFDRLTVLSMVEGRMTRYQGGSYGIQR